MGTSKLKVTGINHVVLHVTDLDRSRTFYMEALGFDDRGSVPGMKASFLRCGMQGLDLFEMVDCDVHGGEEMNHMALNIDVADVELLVAGLSEAGVEVFEITSRNSVFISDPDGHRIEMLPICASERVTSAKVHTLWDGSEHADRSRRAATRDAIACSRRTQGTPMPCST